MRRLLRSHVAPEILAELCGGQLDGTALAETQRHLQGCEHCSAVRERISKGLVAMGQIAEQEAPDLAWDHIGARIYWNTSSERRSSERRTSERSTRERSRPRVFEGWRYGVGVFGVALVVGATLWWLGGDSSGASESSAPVASLSEPTPIAAPVSQVTPEPVDAAVVFSQGAVFLDEEGLNLDAPVLAGSEFSTTNGRLVIQFGTDSAFRVSENSKLTIDRLDSEHIALRVDGQVDVDITRRLPGQEFSVMAGRHKVLVRGTAFRVDYVEGEFGVQCIRGKVVVTDGGHGVHVPAGQRFQVMRDALDDAALRALPIDPQALNALGLAMRLPMLPVWEPHRLSESTALIEVESAPTIGVAVDGNYVADGSFLLRTTVGEHEVAIVDGDGGLGKGRVLRANVGVRAQARLQAPSKPSQVGKMMRKRQLQLAMKDSPRAARCLKPLSKQGLLKGSYLVLDVGVNVDGSQSYLNLQDSNLSPAIQACLRDVVDSQELPSGPSASFRFRLSY